MKRSKWAAAAALLGVVTLPGCTTVEPWERGNLAKPHMALDSNPIQTASREHINDSRQAMPSGSSAEGGGCGCN
ncbi:MAG: DUF4266 domain-containing protein [Terricaulis sp.]